MKTTSSKKWTSEEHSLFIKGCIEHGWGHAAIPTKGVDQVKRYAHKYSSQHLGQRRLLESAHARVKRISAGGKADAILREFDYFMSCVDSGKAQIMHLQIVNQCLHCDASQPSLSIPCSISIGSSGENSVAVSTIPSSIGAFRPIGGASAVMQGCRDSGSDASTVEEPRPLKPPKKHHGVPDEASQLSQDTTSSIRTFGENSAAAPTIPSSMGAFRPTGGASAVIQGRRYIESNSEFVEEPSPLESPTCQAQVLEFHL